MAYIKAMDIIRSARGDSECFPVMMGLHLRSTLITFLLALVIDELTWHIQKEVSGCTSFTNRSIDEQEAQ